MTDKSILSDEMLEKVSGGAEGAMPDSKFKDGDMVRWSQHEDFGLGKVEYFIWSGMTWLYDVDFPDAAATGFEIPEKELSR